MGNITNYINYQNMLRSIVTSSNAKLDQNHKSKETKDAIASDQLLQTVSLFKTDRQSFTTNYAKTDHLQRFLNKNAINYFVELITKKYTVNMKPLSILDICCGYGNPTLSLRKKLQQNGVQIQKIMGYDVSPDMIAFAQQKNDYYPQVQFHRKNIQTQLSDENEFDVVVCLFGLHWMNNLDHTVSKIHKSLKKDGLFLTLTPIDIHDLFDYRTNFISNSRWNCLFSPQEWTLKPFLFEKQSYLQVFNKYFTIIRQEKNFTKFNYSFSQLISFFQSWLPEVRHLIQGISHQSKKDAIAKSYISQFLESIEKDKDGNLLIRSDSSTVFTQHLFHFDGLKK